MPNFCSMLGDDFKDQLGQMVTENIDTLCNHPDDFVGKIIQSIKDKVSSKLKESHLIPSFVRIAMEKSLGMLDSQKSTLAIPLRAAMMAPPMIAACKAGDNTVVKQGIQKTIDEAFSKICGDSHVEEESNKKNNTTTNKKNNTKKNNKNNKKNNSTNVKSNKTEEPVVEPVVEPVSAVEPVVVPVKTEEPVVDLSGNTVTSNSPKVEDLSGATVNTKADVVEELKIPIEEITPKLKEIIDNQEEFKNQNNSEDKKKIREEFEQTKKDAIALQEKINEIMTDKGGDLVFADVINEHYKEYSGYLEKLGLLSTDEDESEEPIEEKTEEKPAEPTAEEKPTEEKTEEKTTEEKPTEEKTEEKPTEEKPTEEKPTEEKTTEEKMQTGGKKTRTRRSSRKQRRTQRKSTRKA